MADSKITALTSISTSSDPANDPLVIVDVSDTSMAATGTTKKVTLNQLLATSPTATLASATITGDLTVDTNVLAVNATTNAVGIGTTVAPAYSSKLRVEGGVEIHTSQALNIQPGNTNPYEIVNRSAGGFAFYPTGAMLGMTLDPSGNVGIGVTPSAWTLKAVQIVNGGIYGSGNETGYYANAFYGSSGWRYINAAGASGYLQNGGSHQWYRSTSANVANTDPVFTQAMTLDASGNLLCGVTSAIFNSRLRVKTSSTSASDYGVYVADSADALVFALRNDGLIYTGTKTASPYNNTTASAANVFVAADGTVGRSTSSLKYKKDVKDSIHGLADVLKLRSVTYKSKNGDDTVFGGLIAEEVHAAGLTEFVAYAPDKTPDSINYGNMVSLLVSAIKELTARVQTLEAK